MTRQCSRRLAWREANAWYPPFPFVMPAKAGTQSPRFRARACTDLTADRRLEYPPLRPWLGAERVGVRWGSPRLEQPSYSHLTLPAHHAGPLPLPPQAPQAGGEGQGLAIRPVPAEHVGMP